jgi:hypothetical protein
VSQHKLVVANFFFWVHIQRSKRIQVPKMKWWKFKEEAAKTFKKKSLRWTLGMKEGMQIACG